MAAFTADNPPALSPGLSFGIRLRHHLRMATDKATRWHRRRHAAYALIRATWRAYDQPVVGSFAAALAFRFLFALAPLAVLALAVAGMVLGRSEAETRLRRSVETAAGIPLPEPVWDAVTALWEGLTRPEARILPTLIALGIVLIGASSLFAELRKALDVMWGSRRRELRSRVISVVVARAFGLSMVVTAGALMVLSVGVNTVARIVARGIGGAAVLSALSAPANQVAIMSGLVVSIALLFRALPGRAPSWRASLAGATLATALFSAARAALAAYIGHFGLVSAFGAAGSMIAVLVWAYYTSRFLLLGAALTGAIEGWSPDPGPLISEG